MATQGDADLADGSSTAADQTCPPSLVAKIPASLSGAALDAADKWVESLRDSACTSWAASQSHQRAPAPAPAPASAPDSGPATTVLGGAANGATIACNDGTGTGTGTGTEQKLDAVMGRLDSTIPAHHLAFVVRSGSYMYVQHETTTHRYLVENEAPFEDLIAS